MAKSVLFILAIISAAFSAPPSPSTQRIVGGEPTFIEEYPYIGSLQLLQFIFWGHNCGGSLITSRSILSASHCFYFYNEPSEWRVRLGSTFMSSGGQLIGVGKIILHEKYDYITLANDVAILRLTSAATLSQAVQTVLIPPPVYNIPDNTVLSVIGWGRLVAGGALPEQLQHVDVNVINQQLCTDRYVYLSTITYWPYRVNDGTICSGILDVGGKDACQGDSGGPVSLRTSEGHVVVGVTSWGFGCADAIYPGVNARTSHYSNWIVENGSS